MNELFINRITLGNLPPRSSYLSTLPVVKNLYAMEEGIELTSPITFLVGENGIGKSTLLEAIAVKYGFNPEGGSRNFNFSTHATHSDLYHSLHLTKGYRQPKDGYFLRAESFYNVATNIDELDDQPSFSPPIISSYGGISLHEQSHGESFFALIFNRFGGNGLYLLDEPEAALSATRQLSLIIRLNELAKNGSQFIIATHSPLLIATPGAQIFSLSENTIESIPYELTENYIVTKRFLCDTDRMLKQLLDNTP
ncbi:MAG: ABC transporter ATP-binding protein [Ruminococcaceae bacterium]|nr:ABC transporter ATP-binding protein [Oscillospiraceae bacterium]